MAPVVTSAAAASSPTVTDSKGRAPNSRTAASASLPFGEVEIGIHSRMPFFAVESVRAFHASRPESLAVVTEPAEIPGGFMASYRDAGGTAIYVLDQSADQGA